MRTDRSTVRVLRIDVDTLGWSQAVAQVLSWGASRESRYVAICNVHVAVTAQQDRDFEAIVNGADMATPDGAPIAWMMRRLGVFGQVRIAGPDLMWELCRRCAEINLPIYFYGSTQSTLTALGEKLRDCFVRLRIVGLESPPFRELTEDEDQAVVSHINASGAGIVFVGLGCPKQERWMAGHRGRINAVMIGVGAAFDFHAGTVARAPRWMRERGLEWMHRLASEPRRLWKRYLVTNTLFIVGAVRQLLLDR